MEQEIFYKDYKIKVIQDEPNESPSIWEDTADMFLVYRHRDFTVERKGFDPRDIYEYLEDCHEQVENHDYDDYWIFPVEAYIHSGVSLSLFNGIKQCYWDSSVTGYILGRKDSIDILMQYYSYPELEDKSEEEVYKFFANNLIKTWNQYLSGEIYGFIIEKPTTYYTISKPDLEKISNTPHGYINLQEFYNRAEEEVVWNEIDSCWGYYGDPEESGLIDEAKSVIDEQNKI
jgi:hypothetical protein